MDEAVAGRPGAVEDRPPAAGGDGEAAAWPAGGEGQSPPRRRLPSGEVEAAGRARRLLEAARDEARRILEEARAEGVRIRAAAREEGWQAGRAEAASEVLRAAAARDRMLASARSDVLDAAAAMAARVLGREAALDPGLACEMAGRALAEVRGRRRLVLHVHPGDAGRVRARWGPAVAVREDPGVSRGGVRLETDAGELDGRLEAQVEALRAALEPDGDADGGEGGGAEGRGGAA